MRIWSEFLLVVIELVAKCLVRVNWARRTYFAAFEKTNILEQNGARGKCLGGHLFLIKFKKLEEQD